MELNNPQKNIIFKHEELVQEPNVEVDDTLVTELELYATSNGEIYHKITEVIIHHLAKIHHKFGYIGIEKSRSYVLDFWVENVIRSYRKDHGLAPVSKKDKVALAERFFDNYTESIQDIYNKGKSEVKEWRAYSRPLSRIVGWTKAGPVIEEGNA
jgi:hypothetical protein